MIRGLAALLTTVLVGCESVQAPERITLEPVTIATDGVRPDISDVAVVWMQVTPDARRIVSYDLATRSSRVVAVLEGNGPFETPRIDDSVTVWGQGVTTEDGLIGSLFVSSVSGGEITELRGEATRFRHSISLPWVVWEVFDPGEPTSIGAASLASGTEVAIQKPDSRVIQPRISSTKIVYARRHVPSSDVDLFVHDLAGGIERQITADGGRKGDATISGAIIVWVDRRSGNADLWSFDLDADREQPLIRHPARQDDPDIDGDWIVWADDRHGNWDVFLYDRSLARAFQLTDAPTNEIKPRVSGRRIVWQRNQGSFVLGIDLLDLSDSPWPP